MSETLTDQRKYEIIDYLLRSDDIVRKIADRPNAITCYAPALKGKLEFEVSWEIWQNYVIVAAVENPKPLPGINCATSVVVATDKKSVLRAAEFFINNWSPNVYALPTHPTRMPELIEKTKREHRKYLADKNLPDAFTLAAYSEADAIENTKEHFGRDITACEVSKLNPADYDSEFTLDWEEHLYMVCNIKWAEA